MEEKSEPSLQRRRIQEPFPAASILRESEEYQRGFPAPRPAPVAGQVVQPATLTNLLAGIGEDFPPIDGIILAAAALYDAPALRGPGTTVTMSDMKTLVPGQVIIIFEGVIWHQPLTGPLICDDDGTPLQAAVPATMFQVVENSGADLRLQKVVPNDRYPMFASLSSELTHVVFGVNIVGIRNLHAMVAAGSLDAPPLPFQPVGIDNTPPLRHEAGTGRMGTPHSPPLIMEDEDQARAAALGAVPLHTIQPTMQVEVQTTSSIRQKAEMTLAVRMCLFRADARALVFGTSPDPNYPDLAAAIRNRMPYNWRGLAILSDAYIPALLTGRFDNAVAPTLRAGVSPTVGLPQALRDPTSYPHLGMTAIAQALELLFRVVARVFAATSPTGAIGTPIGTFYTNLPQHWCAALRSVEADGLGHFSVEFVTEVLLQEQMAAHRSVISTGAERSTTALEARLHVLWAAPDVHIDIAQSALPGLPMAATSGCSGTCAGCARSDGTGPSASEEHASGDRTRRYSSQNKPSPPRPSGGRRPRTRAWCPSRSRRCYPTPTSQYPITTTDGAGSHRARR